MADAEGRFVSPCCQCGCAMWLPLDLFAVAKHSERIIFYCAYGHAQVFPQGDSEAMKLRRERDRLTQKLAEKDDRISSLTVQLGTAVKQREILTKEKTKQARRISRGVCPCCHRTFAQMTRHMALKHPDYGKGTTVQ